MSLFTVFALNGWMRHIGRIGHLGDTYTWLFLQGYLLTVTLDGWYANLGLRVRVLSPLMVIGHAWIGR